MEKRYSTFKKLNWLLINSFEAERVYYNASEDVQEVGLKRYFGHQSVDRNRFSHQISEQLVQAGIDPMKKWAEKGNLDRDWREERKVLVKQRPLKYLKKCKGRDEENLLLYEEILEDNDLPKDILKMLKKQRESIINGIAEGEKFRTGETPLMPENKSKVRTLKAM